MEGSSETPPFLVKLIEALHQLPPQESVSMAVYPSHLQQRLVSARRAVCLHLVIQRQLGKYGQRWPSRSDQLLVLIRIRVWIPDYFFIFFTIEE